MPEDLEMKGHTMQKQTEKAIWNLFQAGKDKVNNAVTIAVASGQLSIDRAALPTLLSLINGSLDQVYTQGISAVDKSLQVSGPLVPESANPKKSKKGS